MRIAFMAVLTQHRNPGFQHRIDVRTVRTMTEGAVFIDRFVIPDEWTALFCMALVAGIDYRITHQALVTRRTMRIMAIGTDHLTLFDGVAAEFLRVHPLLLVAGKTDV